MTAAHRMPEEFLRPLEDDVVKAIRRIAELATQALDRATQAPAADRTAAHGLLAGSAGGLLALGWLAALRAAWQDDRGALASPAEAMTTLAAALTLKDKEEIDEDIELARLTQDLESDCEATLRELRQLYSGLLGLHTVDLQAPWLTPQRCASTLGQAVRGLGAAPSARLLLLRSVVPASLQQLPQVFAADLRRLRDAGVEPAAYQVVPSRDGWVARDSDAGPRIQAVLNRLLSHTESFAGHGEGPSASVSDAWMDGVLQAVQQEARPSPAMGRLLSRLAEPGQQLARSEPVLWQQPDHVWWALLDRLLGVCAVLDAQPGGGQDRFAQSCDDIVSRLLPTDGGALDSDLCRSVLDELSTAAQAFAASAPAPGPGGAASTGPAPSHVAPAPLSGLMKLVREQMSQQLRTSDAPGSVRRFLMGPWLRVVASALDPERGDPAQAQRYTEWVDQLLGSLRGDPGALPVQDLLQGGRTGLASIGLPDNQIDTWVEDLQQRFEERQEAPAEPADASPAWTHEELPTVPIDLHPSAHGARARRDRIAWINGLRVGDICRLQVEDRWYTAQLIVDPVAEGRDDEIFVFQSREPFERLSLTKDALVLLRADGLATTVEPGAFIAKALDTMPADMDNRLPRRKPR